MSLTRLKRDVKASALKKWYLSEPNRRTAQRVQAVYLMAVGTALVDIAKVLSRNVNTIRSWIKRFNDQGLEGLQYKHTGGRRRKLSGEIELALLRLADA